MKKLKKAVAVILAVTMIFSAFSLIPANAQEIITDKGEQKLFVFLDKLVMGLIDGITAVTIGPRLPSKNSFTYDNPCQGMSASEYLTEPAEDAVWSVGYANRSIQDGNELDGKHFVGGSLSLNKVATEVRDDQKVRTVALSDGRGISIFSVIDGFGITNKAVNEIRNQFMEYANEKQLKITSINVSILHQHSCVDTFGMNGNILKALFTAPIKNILGLPLDSGINEDFQKNLYAQTVDSMKEAVETMTEGKLYYGKVDIAEYIYDKRDPQVIDPYLHRLRFVPDNGSKETWIVNGSIHCVGKGAAGTCITGDYPYYMEEYVNSKNANLFYIQGAELAITTEKDNIEPDALALQKYPGDDGYAKLVTYGYTLGRKLAGITADDETEVAPVLNISTKHFFTECTNGIFKFAAKFGLLTNDIVKDGCKTLVSSELSYCEFGKDIAVAIIPGELAPEIAFGGAMDSESEQNWYGTDWDYAPLCELTDKSEFMVFGLTNDQIGYMLTDNSWHSIFTENEEIVSAGQYSGATVCDNYIELMNYLGKADK